MIAIAIGGMALAVRAASPTTLPSATEMSRLQIRAATWDAVHSLRADIESRSIDSNLTVGEFVEKADAHADWAAAIRRAEQIGGPRWIDVDTCQVQLELDGATVVQGLIDIAATHSDKSPLPSAAMASKLSNWSRRSFTATGTSFRADRALDLQPPAALIGIGGGWRDVDDATRRKTIGAAREAAIARILDAVRDVHLTDADTVGSTLEADPKIAHDLHDVLANEPATSVRFSDGLTVSYAISLNGDEFFDAVKNALRAANVQLDNMQVLDAARDAFRSRIGTKAMVGRADVNRADVNRADVNRADVNRADVNAIDRARAVTSVTSTRQQVVTTASVNTQPSVKPATFHAAEFRLPAQPPEWVFRQINVEAVAPFSNSQLRTKHAAEERATGSIRSELNEQLLDKATNTTVEQVARQSLSVRRAVDRAMRNASVYHVEYRPDGSVSVKMMLDPREFWFSIQND